MRKPSAHCSGRWNPTFSLWSAHADSQTVPTLAAARSNSGTAADQPQTLLGMFHSASPNLEPSLSRFFLPNVSTAKNRRPRGDEFSYGDGTLARTVYEFATDTICIQARFVDGAAQSRRRRKLVFLEGGDSLPARKTVGGERIYLRTAPVGDARVEHSQQPFRLIRSGSRVTSSPRGQGGRFAKSAWRSRAESWFQRPETSGREVARTMNMAMTRSAGRGKRGCTEESLRSGSLRQWRRW